MALFCFQYAAAAAFAPFSSPLRFFHADALMLDLFSTPYGVDYFRRQMCRLFSDALLMMLRDATLIFCQMFRRMHDGPPQTRFFRCFIAERHFIDIFPLYALPLMHCFLIAFR